MIDFQQLFAMDSISKVNGESWVFTFEEDAQVFDFLYHSIAPHVSEEGRQAYVDGGLCEDITNTSLCPAFFRSQYIDVFEVLQRTSQASTSKISAKMRCNCFSGNCENCACVKANRICGLWCHSGNNVRQEKVQCQNCDITKLIKQVKKYKAVSNL